MIGPEAPLVDGLADNLRAMGILVFGPEPDPGPARRLEGLHQGSVRAGTASRPPRYARASDRLAAEAALGDFGLPVVIKADGLAAGKGVVIAETAARGRGRARRTCSTAASATPARRW